MLSIWYRDLSWLLNEEDNKRFGPKIRDAITNGWVFCCLLSRRHLRQEEPLQEAMQRAIVKLHLDLLQAPALSDEASAEILIKHYANYVYMAAANERRDARRFVVLNQEIPDGKDFESMVQARLDLATVIKSMERDERDLFYLRYIRNRSWRQVAAQKGISDDAARMRCARAMNKLRKQFGRYNPCL